ncbi:hypothetical protein NQ315_015240, partial [Exocentrus adspersus]
FSTSIFGWSFNCVQGTFRKWMKTNSSANDFVDGGMLLFESKNTGDYHEDMNANVSEEIFFTNVESYSSRICNCPG